MLILYANCCDARQVVLGGFGNRFPESNLDDFDFGFFELDLLAA